MYTKLQCSYKTELEWIKNEFVYFKFNKRTAIINTVTVIFKHRFELHLAQYTAQGVISPCTECKMEGITPCTPCHQGLHLATLHRMHIILNLELWIPPEASVLSNAQNISWNYIK